MDPDIINKSATFNFTALICKRFKRQMCVHVNVLWCSDKTACQFLFSFDIIRINRKTS